MEVMLKVCLIVSCVVTKTVVLAQTQCSGTQAAIVGTAQKTFLEGRVTICDGTELRAVCRDGWDLNDARVLCRELGYPMMQAIQECGEFCNGGESSIPGVTNFTCTGNEDSLTQCTHTLRPNKGRCIGYFAVKCFAAQECTDQKCLHRLTTNSPCKACEDKTECLETRNNTAIIASVLGVVSFILLLALVGVVIVWVWSCRRKKSTVTRPRDTTLTNPTYSQATPTQPSTRQYSHLGPHDTPTSCTPFQGNRDYEEVDEEEDVYHAVGEEQEEESGAPYEVPINTKK